MTSLIVAILLSQFTVQKDGVQKGSATGVNCQGSQIGCTILNGKWMLTVDAGAGMVGAVYDGGPAFDAPLYNDGGTVGCLNATATNAGCVSTTTQTLAGDKGLTGNTTLGSNIASPFGYPLTVINSTNAASGIQIMADNAGTLRQSRLDLATDDTYTNGYSSFILTPPTFSGVGTDGGSLTATFQYVGTNLNRVIFGTQNTAPINFRTQDIDRLTINGNGNVDVNYNLNVVGTATASNLSGTNTGDQTKTCGAGSFITTLAGGTTSTCTTPTAPTYAGTADVTTFLRGDGTWAQIPVVNVPIVTGPQFKSKPITIQSFWPKCSPVILFNCNR